jgi:hypothetical protein
MTALLSSPSSSSCGVALQRSEEGDGSNIVVAFFFFLWSYSIAKKMTATTLPLPSSSFFCNRKNKKNFFFVHCSIKGL